MNQFSSLIHSRTVNVAGGLMLAALWVLFAISHVDSWRLTGNWTYLVFGVAESLSAVLFLMRSSPVAVSDNPWDCLAGVAGTFSPLLFTPVSWGLIPEAQHLMLLGCVLQIAGMLSLNRSFGLVAARRTIKTAGMYRMVRHPLYASYVLSSVGYVLANSSWRNLAVAISVIVLMLLRLIREERVLGQDPAYRSYMQRVPYRLIPFVY